MQLTITIDGIPCVCGPTNWGTVLNPHDGYTHIWNHDEPQRWPFAPKPIFDFKLRDDRPLTWIAPDGRMVRPDRHYLTDDGSVPAFSSIFVCARNDGHMLPCFMMHDSGCRYGTLWVKTGDGPWVETAISHLDCNRILAAMGMAMGEDQWRVKAVYAGVEIGRRLHTFTYGDTPEKQAEELRWRNAA